MRWIEALEQLVAGKRAARPHWRRSWLIYVPGSTITVEADRPLGVAAPDLVGTKVHYNPHVDRYDRGLLGPYLVPPDDELADDWYVVDAAVASNISPSEQDPHA